MHLLFLSSFLCIEIQKLLAQSLPKQFVGECKQIKIQWAKRILAR